MIEKNFHCQWRIDLAKQICKRFKDIEGVAAIAVGGSAARGYADEYSDVEIIFFWEKYPDIHTRKVIVNGLNAEYFYPFNYEANEDNILVNGFRIDLWHLTIERQYEVVRLATEELNTDFGCNNAMDTVRACIPLYGEELFSEWKEKAKTYPRQYAVKNIEESMRTIDCGQLELLLHRQNPTLIFEQIILIQKSIFLMLLALNNRYFPTFKWMYQSMETMDTKPCNIVQRFRDVFTYEPGQAYEQIKAVLLETLDLVKQAFPEIDTEIVLHRLKPARIAHSRLVHL